MFANDAAIWLCNLYIWMANQFGHLCCPCKFYVNQNKQESRLYVAYEEVAMPHRSNILVIFPCPVEISFCVYSQGFYNCFMGIWFWIWFNDTSLFLSQLPCYCSCYCSSFQMKFITYPMALVLEKIMLLISFYKNSEGFWGIFLKFKHFGRLRMQIWRRHTGHVWLWHSIWRKSFFRNTNMQCTQESTRFAKQNTTEVMNGLDANMFV